MEIKKEVLESMWFDMPVDKIASRLNTTKEVVYRLGKKFGLPGRLSMQSMKDLEQQEDDPSPEQIEAATALIRESWPEEEYERRAVSGLRHRRWAMPQYQTKELFGDSEAASYARV